MFNEFSTNERTSKRSREVEEEEREKVQQFKPKLLFRRINHFIKCNPPFPHSSCIFGLRGPASARAAVLIPFRRRSERQ